jgi:hypothetical protein
LSDESLNNDIHTNRGVEFILNGGKRKDKPKTFQLMFGKMVRFLSREVHLYLEFSLDVRKDNPKGE